MSEIARWKAKIHLGCDERGLAHADSVERYVIHGITMGGFLTALFENDLMEAASRADDHNLAALGQWAAVLYNDVPSACKGSKKAVADWIARGGLVGLLKAD